MARARPIAAKCADFRGSERGIPVASGLFVAHAAPKSPFHSLSSAPAPSASESRLRQHSGPDGSQIRWELQIAAVRFRMGDFHGALVAAMSALDTAPIPHLCASPKYLARAKLTDAQRALLACVDGRTALEDLIQASGVGLLEGIDAMSELLDIGVLVLDPDHAGEPRTLPGLASNPP